MKKFLLIFCFIIIAILIGSSILNSKTSYQNSKIELNEFYLKVRNIISSKLLKHPKVSVIIPCYNSERFLEDVFSMIDTQNFSDYEVIFVNDGSTDNTKKLITEYSKRNKRAKLISYNKNKKTGYARNLGLKKAKGDYIIFLDSDDIYLPTLLKTTYDIAVKTNVDIVLFKTNCLDDKTQEKLEYDIPWLWTPPYPENKIFAPEDIKDNLFSFCKGVVWNKLYKKKFLKQYNFSFLNLEIHNDSFFVYTTYVMAKSMYITDKVLYTYRINRKESVFNKNFNLDKICAKISEQELENFLIKNKLYEKYKVALMNIDKY